MKSKNGVLLLIAFFITAFIIYKGLKSIAKHPGEYTYNAYCSKCHGKNGEGIKSLVPPLYHADWLVNNKEQLPCIIVNGLKDTITVNGTVYAEEMLGIPQLNSIQINNVSNYILQKFTKEKDYLSIQETDSLLNQCQSSN